MPRGERPLDPTDGAVPGFAASLRRLRGEAGNPTYRQLAERTDYSAATLSVAAAGRRLPSLAVTLAYVRACGGDLDEWERRWHLVTTESAAPVSPDLEHGDEAAPYVGLTVFQAEDTDRFFGRDRLIEEVVTRLARRRLVAVFGASGAGKSSLLRAGVLPRLRTERSAWQVLLFTPGDRPLEECAKALSTLTGAAPGPLADDLVADQDSVRRLVWQALADQPPDAEAVLVVDQFEEVFTLCPDAETRTRFIDFLILLAEARAEAVDGRCRVVLSIRADFYSHCTNHAGLVDALRDSQVTVGPMTSEELRQAIVQPAVQANYNLESALLATLMAQAHGQSGVLPLLSHTLLETWRRRRGNSLTVAGFQAAGGIDGALAQTAESLYASLDARQEILTKNLFLRLTALGDGTEDTKRRISGDEFEALGPDTAVVLERLARDRLVTLDHAGVEISHEALIRAWPRLREWLAEDREGQRLHRQLIEATAAWESFNHDAGALYRGTRLARAREWAGMHEGALSSRERTFLETSTRSEADEQAAARRHTRRLRQLVALLSVLLLLAVTAVGYAAQARTRATRERDSAIAERVAEQVAQLRGPDPALAAQLSLAAYRLAPTAETRGSLLSTFAAPYATRLTGHTDSVNAAALSPDGHTLATASADHTARLWDVTDVRHPAALAVVTGHTDAVNAVAFSPDGHTLATASADHTTRLWNLTDPSHPIAAGTLVGATDAVNAVAFSPNGRTLATSGIDPVVRLWDVSDPQVPVRAVTLSGHTGAVRAIVFDPDRHTLITASDDHTARLWDISGPTLAGHSSSVYGVAVSPDGHTAASASYDRTVRLWNVADPRRPVALATLTGHTDAVNAVAFSPDGRTLATASLDRTARLWDVTDPRRPVALATLTGLVLTVSTGPGVTAICGPTWGVAGVEGRAYLAPLAVV
ncbi:MAG: hypothetical protein ACQSGP_23530 [Frankia sp.]